MSLLKALHKPKKPNPFTAARRNTYPFTSARRNAQGTDPSYNSPGKIKNIASLTWGFLHYCMDGIYVNKR